MTTLRPGIPGLNAIALGWSRSHSASVIPGRNRDIDMAAPEDIWGGGGLYTGFPAGATATVAETVTAVSSSASDAAAGTGLRSIRLTGLGSTGLEQSETITLNGLTPVTSTLTWYRVTRVLGGNSGSGGTNAGNITVRHSTTVANIFAVMAIGVSDAQNALYTVPVDKIGLLTRASISVANIPMPSQQATCVVTVRPFGTGTWRHMNTAHVTTGQSAEMRSDVGILIPPLADVILRVSASADNLDVAGSFDILTFPIT